MIDLNKYGKVIRTYSGTGKLHFENKRDLDCSFNLAQLSDGMLYALCQIPKANFMIGLDDKVKLLLGRTDADKLINFHPRFITNIQYIQNNSSVVLILGKEFTVSNSVFPEGPVHFKFSITNLNLGGIQLHLTLDNFNIDFSPVSNYNDVVPILKAVQVYVTYEAIFRADSVEHRDNVLQVMNNLCLILTLARGCRIEWINYDVMINDGQVFESFHRNAITKPYGTIQLIATTPIQDTLDFINKTYPALKHCEQKWELRKAIDAYTDAKIEVDFLESRALKMVIVMEHLKGRYLNQHGKNYLINPKIFQKYEQSIIKLVQCMLRTMFPKIDTKTIELMANHTRGFYWYPFRRSLSELCCSIGLKINSEERNRFVEIRNDLVHRMAFNSKQGSSWEQYTFVMTFVVKIILSILEYDGYFYDWTEPPGDMKMHKKLDLETKKNSHASQQL